MQTSPPHETLAAELHRLRDTINKLLHCGDIAALARASNAHVRASLLRADARNKVSVCVDTSDAWHVTVPADAPMPGRCMDVPYHPLDLPIGVTLTPTATRCTSMSVNYHTTHPVEETAMRSVGRDTLPVTRRVVGHTRADGKALIDLENCTTDVMIMTIQTKPFDSASVITETFACGHLTDIADRIAEFAKLLLYVLTGRGEHAAEYVHSIDVVSGRYAEVFNATICDEYDQQTVIAHAVVTPRSRARATSKRVADARPSGRI